MFSFYEFFAGGGMARAGLGERWNILMANDIDQTKAKAYAENWGRNNLIVEDVAKLSTANLHGQADLAWASFPCQDLSLAGPGAGIRANRSGTFWPFMELIRGLSREDREPNIIVLENVYGAVKSDGGKDFAAIGSALSGLKYNFGAMIIDAADFLPQSRPRLFIIGISPNFNIPERLQSTIPSQKWHPQSILEAQAKLSIAAINKWIWWDMAIPPRRQTVLADVLEDEPEGVKWHSREETDRLLGMMSDVNFAKVEKEMKLGTRSIGGVYRRTRNGVQRAEVRFDNIAGCLRTPVGGSSRQTILIIEGQQVCSRLLSPREAARLMGLPDTYQLPKKYNDAYHLAGDGVAVPVVRYLAENILEPILDANISARNVA